MVESTSSGRGCGGPDDAVFVPGVDYVSAWLEADEAAQQLNAALERLGYGVKLVRAVAHAGPRGEPVVWLRMEGVRVIAQALGAVGSEQRQAG